jgi:uncharacterized protein GlcG (DUF336 family)
MMRRFCLFLIVSLVFLCDSLFAIVPTINTDAVFNRRKSKLTITGQNFQTGARVALYNKFGIVTYATATVASSTKIVVSGVVGADIRDLVKARIYNPDGNSSTRVRLTVRVSADSSLLTADDVRTVIAQSVAQAEASGLRVTVAVTDKEGNVLGVFRMTGARGDITIGIGTACASTNSLATLTCGLEGITLEDLGGFAGAGSALAAISKAGTAGVLSTAGGAFTPRIASFLLQEHIPPGIRGAPSGPLFGVQFSQLLCSDVDPTLPLGLAADPGGIPLYKNGQPVGGVGVEGDGKYSVANRRETREDKPLEELIALAGSRGYEAPAQLRDTLFPGGLRLPFANQEVPPALPLRPFDQLSGAVLSPYTIRDTPLSHYKIITIGDGIQVRTRVNIPIKASPTPGGLTADEVERVLVQGVRQALITRAVIHQPVGSHIEVSVGVVDENGAVLGAVSTLDAPISSYDISVQKARSAAFFSNPGANAKLNSIPRLAKYAQAAQADGLRLDGSVAFSGRALIFLSRPFLPDGIDGTAHGPFSNPIEENSAFNTGLQLDVVLPGILSSLGAFLASNTIVGGTCTPGFPAAANGFQVRQASVPLYKNGRLVGGVGCSGDGGEQEDIVVGYASAGFEAEPAKRSDRVFVRGVRLPWLKYPRQPNI